MAIVWVLGVSARWWTTHPHLPFDSGHDPETLRLFDQVLMAHSVEHLVAAILPPLFMLVYYRLMV
jgi:hypothetical protein